MTTITQERSGIVTPVLWRISPASRPALSVIAIIIFTTIVRFALASATGLGSDESYTVANARQFAASYVDYPPLHLWIVHGWSWLTGSVLPGVLRVPFVLFFAGTSWLMFQLTNRLFGQHAAFWAVIALNIAPVFSLADGVWILPDGPLIFFELAAALVVARLLFAQQNARILWWAIAGLLVGLAILDKYHGLFIAAAVFLFLATQRQQRGELLTPGPWIAASIAAVIFLPVLWWNARHGWAGLIFQWDRYSTRHLDILAPLADIAGQAIYLGPWLFALTILSFVKAIRVGPSDERSWYLVLLAGGPIAIFTLSALASRGLPHWTMPGWLFTLPLAGEMLARSESVHPALTRWLTGSAALIFAAAIGLFATQARSGWITADFPQLRSWGDPTLDVVSWDELRSAIQPELRRQNAPAALAGLTWYDAGKLNSVAGRSVPVLCLCADPQQFRFLHDTRSYVGKAVLVIGRADYMRKHELDLDRWFSHHTFVRTILLHRRSGRPAVTLFVYRGEVLHVASTPTDSRREGRNQSTVLR